MKLIFLLVLLVTACGKEEVITEDSLFSKWSWQYSTGGMIVTTSTPESTGKNIIIEFTTDSIYTEYVNGELLIESNFHIIDSVSVFNHDIVPIIVYDKKSIRQSFTMQSKGLLYLNDEMADGFQHRFKAIK